MTGHVDRRFYRFGRFRLDPTGRILFRGKQAVPLPPKAADTLLLLVENAGNVIEKQDLLKHVWRDAFVEEGSLTRTISILRKALGGAGGQEFICTIPTRGYRFAANVEGLPSVLAPAHSSRIMLAVLPFENMSGQKGQEYFSDGFTEEMITQLGRLNPDRLGVIARTSAMHYKSSTKTVHQIGQELDVTHVVEGSVRRASGCVRIAAQLIQVSDQTHLWAESYEGNTGDILALQNEMAQAIARQIQIKLIPKETEKKSASGSTPPEAYEAYLRGRYLWNLRTLAALQKSIKHFEKAIRIDPAYAASYAGMADSYLSLLDNAYLPTRAATAQARQWARKAIAIDGTFAEPHSSLGHAHFHEFEWTEAEREFQRSIALNPNYPAAHFYYANYLVATGRYEEAVVEAKKALALDPLCLAAQANVASIYYRAGRYDEAVEESRRVLDIDTNYAHAHYILGRAYVQKGMYREAIQSSRRAAALEASNTRYVASLAHIYGVVGKRSNASELLGKIKHLMLQQHVPAYVVAICYVGLGKKDEALAWLTRACEECSAESPFLNVDPRLAALRVELRFKEIVRKLGLER